MRAGGRRQPDRPGAALTGQSADGRIDLLDVLRGVAIVGTLGTNIWLFAVNATQRDFDTGTDGVVQSISDAITNGKFLGMLTILFGVGLAIQYASAMRRGARWPWRYEWRNALLLAEGALHFVLVMEFDILMGYAVTGMLAALVVARGDRAIRRTMIVAGCVHVVGVVLVTLALTAEPIEGPQGPAAILPDTEVYRSGSYAGQIDYRLQNALEFRAEAIAIVPLSTFLFLLGLRLYRAGAFRPDAGGRRLRGLMLRWGLGIGLPLAALGKLPGLAEPLLAIERYLVGPLVAVGYIGAIGVLVDRGALPWLRRRLAEVGRTALSCYILQNVIASVLMYSWGFALQPAGAVAVVGLWALISALLSILAAAWLRRFRQGPFEWVQRTLVDLPGRRKQAPLARTEPQEPLRR